jgi:phage terminase large subunit
VETLHGEGSDYFVAQVLDNSSGRQVAVLHKQFDADEYTRQVYCLAKYYNDALVGIEANFDTFPIKYLEKLGYEKQFIRKREDNFTGKTNKSFGFKTDKITRPLILSELQAIVNDHVGLINDKTTLDEMLNFVKNEHGRAEAQQGSHDDLVMALAIAYYIRPQQDYSAKIDVKVLQENIRKDFGAEFDTASSTQVF